MRFSIKRVTKRRTPMIFLSVFNFFETVDNFFLKNLFFILNCLRPVSPWTMCLASRLLENHKWLLENTNQSPARTSPARVSPARVSYPEEISPQMMRPSRPGRPRRRGIRGSYLTRLYDPRGVGGVNTLRTSQAGRLLLVNVGISHLFRKKIIP